MEQCLQSFLGVVVAELLKRGATLLLSQTRVLETRCVHYEQRTQRVLAGLQRSKEQADKKFYYFVRMSHRLVSPVEGGRCYSQPSQRLLL